jgi:FixJ family two-component response regulator
MSVSSLDGRGGAGAELNITKAPTARIELGFRTGLDACPQSGIVLQDPNIVLVVDDDLGVLDGVRRLLRVHAYEPILFSSAEAFKSHTEFEKVVCVILDINLSDGSGIELRHRLNDIGVFVPAIYMTGNDDPAVHKAALDSGCIAFLTKPFPVQSLIEPLKKVSAGR